MLAVEVANEQNVLPIDVARIESIVCDLLSEEGVTEGEISIAIVDDPTIHRLNRQHLAHDYPTDVLSFVLAHQGGRLEGEIIVSADTAIESSQEYGWTAWQELCLYVIHGALHLVGFRDKQPADEQRMRAREQHYLRRFQLVPVD